ncbi:MAG: citrate synthase, partial [Cellulosimicrobium funkei]
MTTTQQAKVRLLVDDQAQDLPVVAATEGNDGIVVSSLLKSTGLVTVDPGFMNTASCESSITYIDGEAG